MLTTKQVRERTKFVTRRLGWWNLKAGDLVRGVEKAMGLKAGEKIKPICTIRIVSTTAEPLSKMIENEAYGIQECILEGFGGHPDLANPHQFVPFFCKSHKDCTADTVVNRIEFEYVG